MIISLVPTWLQEFEKEREETTDATYEERCDNKDGNGQTIWGKKGEAGLLCQ